MTTVVAGGLAIIIVLLASIANRLQQLINIARKHVDAPGGR
jgi:hypothetical protein